MKSFWFCFMNVFFAFSLNLFLAKDTYYVITDSDESNKNKISPELFATFEKKYGKIIV